MASKRNKIPTGEWNKHLGGWKKRKVEKLVRASAKKEIKKALGGVL